MSEKFDIACSHPPGLRIRTRCAGYTVVPFGSADEPERAALFSGVFMLVWGEEPALAVAPAPGQFRVFLANPVAFLWHPALHIVCPTGAKAFVACPPAALEFGCFERPPLWLPGTGSFFAAADAANEEDSTPEELLALLMELHVMRCRRGRGYIDDLILGAFFGQSVLAGPRPNAEPTEIIRTLLPGGGRAAIEAFEGRLDLFAVHVDRRGEIFELRAAVDKTEEGWRIQELLYFGDTPPPQDLASLFRLPIPIPIVPR